MTDFRRSGFRPHARVTRRPQRAIGRAPAPYRAGPFSGDSGHEPWEIAINGDLTDKQTDLVQRLMDVPRKSSGTIFFDTGGGSAYVGLAIASLIRLRGLRATAVVVSECSSAAIVAFAACERRFITPQATMLFHPIRWSSEEEVKLEEAAEWARHFGILERDLDQLISKLLPLSEEKLAAWTRPGRFVSAQEIVDAGLAQMVDLFSGDVWSQIARLK